MLYLHVDLYYRNWKKGLLHDIVYTAQILQIDLLLTKPFKLKHKLLLQVRYELCQILTMWKPNTLRQT